MARKGENIYKRKDGRWEARYEKAEIQGTDYLRLFVRKIISGSEREENQ